MIFSPPGDLPVVSVCLITYNHEKFIATAIESVLMQETEFACELIIGEDCSTDATRAIVESYAEKYPIRLILHDKNVGMQKNFWSVLNEIRGKYVAFFEGDDSWTDPLKLKKQVDILEADEKIVMCFSNAYINDTQNPDSSVYFTSGKKPMQRMDKYDVLKHCVIPTCTTIYRRVIQQYPEWIHQASALAYFHFYLLSKHGDVYYHDEVQGMYNHHYNGLSRKTNFDKMLFHDALLNYKLIPYFDGDEKIKKIAISKNLAAIDDLFHRQEFRLARRLFWKLPIGHLLTQPSRYSTLLKSFLKTHFFTFLSKNVKRGVY